MQPDSEVVIERRRDYIGGVAPAVLITAFVVLAIGRNPRVLDRHAETGTAWIVAVVAVCVAAALAAVMRLMSGTPASVGQWLRRYSGCLALLTPAGLTLTRQYNAGRNSATCGTLVDGILRSGPGFETFQQDCHTAAQTRLFHLFIWVAVAGIVVVAYGLRLRRRRQASAAELSAVAD